MQDSDTLIVYVPGLGDMYDGLRRLALKHWRKKRGTLRVEFVPMRWSDKSDSFESKVERINQVVSRANENEKVVLMGESAGGAMAIGVGLQHQRVDRVVTLCGKNYGSHTVSQHLYRRNPAFQRAMLDADEAVGKITTEERQRLRTVYSSHDPTVGKNDTVVEGVDAYDLKTPGHLFSIALALTKYRKHLIGIATS